MKAYKLELLIIDFDELGPDEIKEVIANTRYPNHCMHPEAMDIQEAEIGEWDDNHPLNNVVTSRREYEKIFGNSAGKGRGDE